MIGFSRLSVRATTAIALIFIAIGLAAILLFKPPEVPPPGTPPSPQVDSPDLKFEIQFETARKFQRESQWVDAKNSFDHLLEQLPEGENSLRDDVERNLLMLKALIPRGQEPKIGEEVKVPNTEIEKIPSDKLLEWYPVDKVVRSNCVVTVTGMGSNEAWGLKGEAHFALLARVGTTTRILENNAQTGRLIFEQSIDHVIQTRRVTEQTLQLELGDGSLFQVLDIAREQLGPMVPYYEQSRRVGQLLKNIDPKLKSTLTILNRLLKQNGLPISDDDETGNWAVQVGKLAGTKVRVVYDSNFGVTSISRVSGPELKKEELIRLAHASSQLMDYFIFPAARKKVGDKWDVQAKDISGLALPFDLGAEVSGGISLRREPDSTQGKSALLRLTGGVVTVADANDQASQKGRLTITSGEMNFSINEKIVRDARVEFEANSLYQSRDHLLFGTKRLRNLKIESRYQAQRVNSAQLSESEIQ